MGLIACSGPQAMAEIAESIEIAYIHATIAGGLLLVSLAIFLHGRRQWFFPVVLVGLLVTHPAWTISAITGDCGYFKRDASYLFTGIGCIGLCSQLIRMAWLLARRGSVAEAYPEYEIESSPSRTTV